MELQSVPKSQSRGPPRRIMPGSDSGTFPQGRCLHHLPCSPRTGPHTHTSVVGPQSPPRSHAQHQQLRLPAFLGKAPHSPFSPSCFWAPGSPGLCLAFSSGGSCGDRTALVALHRRSPSWAWHVFGPPSQGAFRVVLMLSSIRSSAGGDVQGLVVYPIRGRESHGPCF